MHRQRSPANNPTQIQVLIRRATPTQNPSKPTKQNKPTGQVTNAAGNGGQNQVNVSTKKPSQQPNTNSGTNSRSVAPTQNPSKPTQQNKPTGQVTNAAGNGGQN